MVQGMLLRDIKTFHVFKRNKSTFRHLSFVLENDVFLPLDILEDSVR